MLVIGLHVEVVVHSPVQLWDSEGPRAFFLGQPALIPLPFLGDVVGFRG